MNSSTSISQIGNNYLSLEQAAQLLGVTERTVRSYVARGRLAAEGGGHGRALYFRSEQVVAFRRPRRGPAPKGVVVESSSVLTPPLTPTALRVDWSAVLGAEELARILTRPPSQRAAAFEKAVQARDPHLIGALRARYQTLSWSTIKRALAREVVDVVSRNDETEMSLVDRAQAREYLEGASRWEEIEAIEYQEEWDDEAEERPS